MRKLSVICPVCNAQAYLRRCLDTLAEQTVRDMEIICVDDGSTDGSVQILEEYAGRDPRMRVVTQENRGQGAARNRGVTIAKGEYIYFMDADDELAVPDALKRLLVEVERERLDVLFFDAETRCDDGVEFKNIVKKEDYVRLHDYSAVFAGSELFARFLKNREYSVSPCLAIYRRGFLEEKKIRFPSERIFYEDNIFMTRVLLAAQRVSHRPWRLYLRKVHAGSTVTSNPTMRHLRGYLACYRDVRETLSRCEWDRPTRRALVDRQVVYKLNVRRMADSFPELVSAAKGEMSTDEYDALCKALVYPIGEKVVNAIRCWREHGFRYTLRRVLRGRQR